MPAKLTARQSAVLAAIDRRAGAATLLDLGEDFPQLAPSAVARVIDALQARGLVTRRGDPAQIHLGGVTFVSVTSTLGQRNTRLADLKEIFESDGWTAFVEGSQLAGAGPSVVVLLPLDEIGDAIRGKESELTRLRDFIGDYEDVAWSQLGVEPELSINEGRVCLKVSFVNNEPSDAEWKQIDGADQIDWD